MAATTTSLPFACPAPAPRAPWRRLLFASRALIALGDLAGLCVAVALAGMGGAVGFGFVAVAFALLAVRGHHQVRIAPSLAEDAAPLLGCLAVALVLVTAAAGRFEVPGLVRAGAGSALAVIGLRAVSYALIRRARARGMLVEPTLVIGAGQVGSEIVEVLRDHPEYGLSPVGFLDSFDDHGLPAPVLGPVSRLDAVLRDHAVRRVIIAFGAVREPDIVPIVRACDRAHVDIHVVPRFFELGFAANGPDVDKVWGLPLLRLRRAALRSRAWRLKRVFDVLVAGTALVLLAPVYGVLALAVRLSSPGPVLFRQVRVGRNGEEIPVLKFRSMRVNADADTAWSVDGDPRVTPVGRILRKTSLDELPQLLNVLKGEMSLVGPRPERPFFVRRFQAGVRGYGDRHRVPAGLTGLAQVHGLRGDTSIAQRVRFDNQYIENWSLWQDLVILLRTFAAVLRDACTRGHPRTERPPRAPAGSARGRTTHPAVPRSHRPEPLVRRLEGGPEGSRPEPALGARARR